MGYHDVLRLQIPWMMPAGWACATPSKTGCSRVRTYVRHVDTQLLAQRLSQHHFHGNVEQRPDLAPIHGLHNGRVRQATPGLHLFAEAVSIIHVVAELIADDLQRDDLRGVLLKACAIDGGGAPRAIRSAPRSPGLWAWASSPSTAWAKAQFLRLVQRGAACG